MGHEVIELLTRLHAGGQTIVLVTHDAGVAGAAQRVVRMRDGRITSPQPGDAGAGGRADDAADEQPARTRNVAIEAR
jgi:ABC-type lipoprotein export system ATPase subunit